MLYPCTHKMTVLWGFQIVAHLNLWLHYLKWERIMTVKVEREDMRAQELRQRAGRVKDG